MFISSLFPGISEVSHPVTYQWDCNFDAQLTPKLQVFLSALRSPLQVTHTAPSAGPIGCVMYDEETVISTAFLAIKISLTLVSLYSWTDPASKYTLKWNFIKLIIALQWRIGDNIDMHAYYIHYNAVCNYKLIHTGCLTLSYGIVSWNLCNNLGRRGG